MAVHMCHISRYISFPSFAKQQIGQDPFFQLETSGLNFLSYVPIPFHSRLGTSPGKILKDHDEVAVLSVVNCFMQ